MYAIIENGSKQYKAAVGDIVNFEKIDFSSDLSKFIWRSLLQYHVDKVSVSKLYYRVWHGSKWYDYTFESSLLRNLRKQSG